MNAQPSAQVPFAELPEGTVTFLFTDIEGSTQLLARLRDQYAQVLEDQRNILRKAFATWNGTEIDTQGDSFFAAFPRASDALGCVIEAQHALAAHAWPQGAAVRVRMGLHTGEPLVVGGGQARSPSAGEASLHARGYYVGMDVHQAARVAAAGHGGQVLLSQTTRDLVYRDLPQGSLLRDLGIHKLKDIRFPQQIYQLDIEGLQVEFPTLKTLSAEQEPPTPGQPPYKGLQSFDVGDADWFFGREEISRRLAGILGTERFLAVIGASGSGKSSVVRAGLVPALERGQPEAWQIYLFTPGPRPLESLSLSLTRASQAVGPTAALIDDLGHDARSLHLYAGKELASVPRSQRRILLIIDQFEELFTQCRSEPERQAFVDNLVYAVEAEGSSLSLVIALRADFYQHLAAYEGLRRLVARRQEYLGVMSTDELRCSIEEPARLGGWEFSPGLVELILHDLGAAEGRQPEPGALPLLSHALLETWKRRRGNIMTLKSYSEAGGVRAAISRTAERVFYGELSPEQQKVARSIFMRLAELGEGVQDTRRRALLSELIPPAPYGDSRQVQEVLNRLADARLVTVSADSVEIAHEALIREWQTLREWLSQDREGLRVHRHLTDAAREWKLLHQDPGLLYRGARLAQALEWAESRPHELNTLEEEFLHVSRAQIEQEQNEKEAQRQRELRAAQKLAEVQSQAAANLRRRAIYLMGALGLAVILAAVAIIFGKRASQNAVQASRNEATARAASTFAVGEANARGTQQALAVEQAHLAFSRELAAAALTSLGDDQERAVLLAMEALKQADTQQAEEALHRTIQELRILHTLEEPGVGFGLAWRSDGRQLAASGSSGAAVWDPDSGTLLYSRQITEGMINRLAFSPDGSLLVLPGEGADYQTTGYVSILDANTGRELLTFTGHKAFVQYASFSPDGRQFATASGDGTIKVWDVAKTLASGEGQSILTVTVAEGSIPWTVQFSPDGAYLATANDDEFIHFLDAKTGRQLWQVPTYGYVLSFSPDGNRLVISGSVGMLDVLETSSGKRLSRTRGHTLDVNAISFSPDGGRLATACKDGTVKIWTFSEDTLTPLFTLSGHKGQAHRVAFSPDGRRLASGGADGTVRIWDISPTGSVEPVIYQHLVPAQAVAFSPDGTRVTTGATDGNVVIWEPLSGQPLHTLSGKEWIWCVAYNPEGDLLATTAIDATVKLWDPATGTEISTLTGHEGRPDTYFFRGVLAAAFSPDGERLATAGGDGGVHVWDVAALRKADLGIGDELFSLEEPGELKFAYDVAYSPDGRWIAAAVGNYTDIGGYASEDEMIKVWDATTKQLMWTMRADLPNYGFLTVSFSQDGKRLATGDLQGQAIVWKLPEGPTGTPERLFTIKAGQFFVYKLNFSPDGAQLAVPYSEGMGIWDANTGEPIGTLPHPGTTFQAVYSRDGKRLATVAIDGLGRLFFMDIDELVAMAKSRLTRSLTLEECQQYLHMAKCPETP